MKRVFISFKAEDKDHVNGIRLLASNPNHEIEFYDESVTEPYNSQNSDYIKGKIKEKIRRSTVTLCLISKETHLSDWVNWEIRTSHEEGKIIYPMAIKGITEAILPSSIKNLNLTFHAWDPQAFAKFLENLK